MKRLADMLLDVVYLSVLSLLVHTWAHVFLRIWPDLEIPFFALGVGLIFLACCLRPHAKQASRQHKERYE